MTGKMAKFNVAGRIEAVKVAYEEGGDTCDYGRFAIEEAARLKPLADTSEEKRAWNLGVNDALAAMDAGDLSFCEQLYIDAGNWSMLKEVAASKDQLRVIMLSAASRTTTATGTMRRGPTRTQRRIRHLHVTISADLQAIRPRALSPSFRTRKKRTRHATTVIRSAQPISRSIALSSRSSPRSW
ncbi:hypothetical protein [Mesorhizobium delmotii]|nr:hypothetical protein [Mesorhizobium delmotii]